MPAEPETDAPTAARSTGLDDVAREPGVGKPDPILTVDGVHKAFGGLVAVDVDHLEVQRGTITALIGPNGAGKTTLFNLLTGFDRPDRGSWSFHPGEGDEVPLSGKAPHDVARTGLVRTFQLTKSLSRMSVIENMRLGAANHPGESFFGALLPARWRGYEDEVTDRADVLLERFQLRKMREEYAGTLSGGQRKLLEMARSLMVGPELVCLDEPMAGVNPVLTQSLLEHVKGLREDGMTVIFVEHDMDVVMEISDWVVVLAEGHVISEGPPRHVGSDPAVVKAYLGGRAVEQGADLAPGDPEDDTDDGGDDGDDGVERDAPDDADEGTSATGSEQDAGTGRADEAAADPGDEGGGHGADGSESSREGTPT